MPTTGSAQGSARGGHVSRRNHEKMRDNTTRERTDGAFDLGLSSSAASTLLHHPKKDEVLHVRFDDGTWYAATVTRARFVDHRGRATIQYIKDNDTEIVDYDDPSVIWASVWPEGRPATDTEFTAEYESRVQRHQPQSRADMPLQCGAGHPNLATNRGFCTHPGCGEVVLSSNSRRGAELPGAAAQIGVTPQPNATADVAAPQLSHDSGPAPVTGTRRALEAGFDDSESDDFDLDSEDSADLEDEAPAAGVPGENKCTRVLKNNRRSLIYDGMTSHECANRRNWRGH